MKQLVGSLLGGLVGMMIGMVGGVVVVGPKSLGNPDLPGGMALFYVIMMAGVGTVISCVAGLILAPRFFNRGNVARIQKDNGSKR